MCRGTNRDEGELPSVELFGDLVKYNRFFFQLYDLKKIKKNKVVRGERAEEMLMRL